MPDGKGNHFFGVNKAFWREIGLGAGASVHVVMERDTEERVVAMPEDLVAALDREPRARAFFDTLSYTHRKEFANWIAGARRPETRAARLERTIGMLLAGVRHP